MLTTPMPAQEKNPLLSKWTILAALAGVLAIYLSHQPKVSEWVVSKSPAFLFDVPAEKVDETKDEETAKDDEIKKPKDPMMAKPGPVPPPVAKPQPVAVPAVDHSANDCAAWGKDSAGHVNCLDHKKKVQVLLQSERERLKDIETFEMRQSKAQSKKSSKKSKDDKPVINSGPTGSSQSGAARN